MSTGLLDSPAAAPGGEFPPEVLQFAASLMQKAQAQQHTPYRKALLERIARRQRLKLKEDPPASELPEGGYRTYRVVSGRHSHYDKEEQKKARATYWQQVEEAKSNPRAQPPDLISPVEHVFGVGDLVTPQDDHEALMMDQDAFSPLPKKKFQLVGTAAEASDRAVPDEVTVELNRLRTQADRAAAVEEENAKLRKELEEARKNKRGGNNG